MAVTLFFNMCAIYIGDSCLTVNIKLLINTNNIIMHQLIVVSVHELDGIHLCQID